MAPELDIGMGFGMESFSSSSATSNAYFLGLPSADTSLHIDDLLDFSTQDGIFDAATTDHHHYVHPPADPYGGATGNCSVLPENNSSGSHLATFTDDLYMPSEEAAELEWLSKFVEDSFTDMPFPSPATMGATFNNPPVSNTTNSNSYHHNAVPGRARSKRSRAPVSLSTHLSQLSTSPSSSSSSSSETKHGETNGGKKDMSTMVTATNPEHGNGWVRKCTHCSSEKTPQWRTGPLGPKTLCNACGVRYKSGRLVPEYRPAASPTFILTQHSNSHRKVMELRRQKDLLLRHHREPSTSAVMGNANSTGSNSRPDLLLS